jgi:hypothetical protein
MRRGREDRSQAQFMPSPEDRFLPLSKRSRLFRFTKLRSNEYGIEMISRT